MIYLSSEYDTEIPPIFLKCTLIYLKVHGAQIAKDIQGIYGGILMAERKKQYDSLEDD